MPGTSGKVDGFLLTWAMSTISWDPRLAPLHASCRNEIAMNQSSNAEGAASRLHLRCHWRQSGGTHHRHLAAPQRAPQKLHKARDWVGGGKKKLTPCLENVFEVLAERPYPNLSPALAASLPALSRRSRSCSGREPWQEAWQQPKKL